jgi:predicted small lipoprotein YifL|tara:strand:- start:337 stop:468 length:132 start_codon:yes stop_codon:yes gene_type:complete
MKKKIILALLICFVTISCGKKGDPVYMEPKKKATIKVIFLNKA